MSDITPDICINNAQHEDIPQLIALLDELFSIEVDFKPNAVSQKAGLTLILSMPERAVIKVARDAQQKVIGMVSAQLVISSAQGTPSVWVEDMVIHTEYRQAGIGKKLLAALQAWAIQKGATRMQLLVDTGNERALGYYQHLGWESTQLQARRLFIK